MAKAKKFTKKEALIMDLYKIFVGCKPDGYPTQIEDENIFAYNFGFYTACDMISKRLVESGAVKWNTSTPPKSPTTKSALNSTTTSTTKGTGKKATT